MATTITLKATGLNTDPNQLELPEGSLIEAKNVIIKRDNVIEPVRGYKLFGEAFGSSSDRAKVMWEYKDRIIRHFGDTLQFQNGVLNSGVANFDDFSGSYLEPQPGYRIKETDSSGNLYFTTSEGIKKISAKTADQFSTAAGFITNAGGIKAVDFTATLKVVLGDQSSFLPQDSAVAYRVVWNTNDANNILIQGTPSQREEVFNPMTELLVRDTNNVLLALDYVSNAVNVSMIGDGDYVNSLSLPITATAAEIRNALIALTGKIDTDILFANNTGSGAPLVIDITDSVYIRGGIYTIHFTSGDPSTYFQVGDTIYLDGFDTVISGTMDGVQTVAAVDTSSVTLITTVPDSVAEVETVQTLADVSSSLNNKYFFIDEVAGNGYYVWFNVAAGGTDPGPFGARTAVPVAIPVNSNAAQVASALAVAMSAIAGTPYSATVDDDIVTITHTVAGTVAGASDAGSTGFTYNVATKGSNSVAIDPTNATITSGLFRNITQPDSPDVPTPNQELVVIQNYLQTILTDLQLEPAIIIDATSQTDFLSQIDITKTASVILNITIPDGVTTNYFYQVYRSSITSATGTTSIDDIVPNDELQLVYEAYPTADQLVSRHIIITDVTPDEFRGANLYTNAATGEGILQANDVPPFALDINRFKNVVFYANTRTRHLKTMSLLGVQNMIDEYNNGGAPTFTIISEDGTVNTYFFVTGEYEITQIVTNAASTLAATGPGSYFLINSGEDQTSYYVWYQTGTNTDPAIAGKTGIQVVISTGDSDAVVANKTTSVLLAYSYDFGATNTTNTISVVCINPGYTTDSSDGNTGFVITTPQQGRGEDDAAKQVLLSPDVSVGQAVDQTARSLVRVINANQSDVVNAYYTSSSSDVPGQFYLEARNLDDTPFYIIGDSDTTGASFNPDISPTFTISSITTGLNPVITTTTPHNVGNNEKVIVALTDSTPSIDGEYVAKFISTTQFSVELNAAVTIAGTSGVGYDFDDSIESENEDKPNRIYYSKPDQPEAVPTSNFLNVGDSDKEILRIFPLRDSLFVFKEDGLYRISGEIAPFTVALFDTSVQITAPDTLDISNNILYCLTTQGVTEITEGGTSNDVTRPIETQLKQVVTIPAYKTASFGFGYESDNAYLVCLPLSLTDTNAKIIYRYSTKTNSWTILDRNTTCGFINPVDDKMYVGCGDTNFIEQERKDFQRTDYSGRETTLNLADEAYSGTTMKFNDITGIAIGDVLVQTQDLTVYEYNMLLKKLDIDPGVPVHNYFTTLQSVGGDDMRAKLVALASKLDTDLGVTDFSDAIANQSGTITSITTGNLPIVTTSAPHNLVSGRFVSFTGTNSTPSIDGNYVVTVTSPTTFTIVFSVNVSGTAGTFTTQDEDFSDIKGCYNEIIILLNANSTVAFSNYHPIANQTNQEAIVTAINPTRKTVTVNLQLDFIVGPLTMYKAIETIVTYGPNLIGDPVNYKIVREATIMFINKAFTSAELSFCTDLLPEFIDVPFNGDSNGIFGNQAFGTGFFGGNSNSAPFRTYIPRQCMRCRYLVVRFTHTIARETYGIYGMTLTGENTQSTRAYRG